MIKLYDILKAEKTGLSDSLFTALLAKKLSGSPAATVKTLEGVPPLTFSAIGEPLIEWSIDGNMQQTGTPSSASPIFPSETGELVESGAHSGEYAIPFVCGGSTTNIYLSEPIRKLGTYKDIVSSSGTVNRQIKQLVLQGGEIVAATGNAPFRLMLSDNGQKWDSANLVTWGCSHFRAVDNAASWTQYNELISASSSDVSSNKLIALRFRDTSITSAEDFNAFLAQEYANGTPVTVWYVLATAETETFTAPTIPTANGSNTLNVNTTLAPSNVYIKYKG